MKIKSFLVKARAPSLLVPNKRLVRTGFEYGGYLFLYLNMLT